MSEADGGEGGPSTPQPQAPQAQSPASAAKKDEKVRILVKNVGNAPILKTTEFSANSSSQFSRIIQHIQAKIRTSENHKDAVVHLFINQSFAPSPDEQLGDLFKCFQSDGRLVVDYALMEAWG
eukprot:CAMPEP_0184294056 /NCGR_PEP_ID=MMETSP1049-20130417/5338_1 /TAXON_ID=77928 /ORGANISM="Proteomonas sulcata, Strain CCMP704" /LENGTH=122 /DNA_ID=CAMNT_0026602217 /DNA_START=626 /DNA_END=994 /DNA_ORIENTATION=+